MKTDPFAIGSRVHALRVKDGISQREAALKVMALELDRVRFSAAYLSRIERGERVASPRVLEALAITLGTTAEYLETGELWWTVNGVKGGDSGFVTNVKAPDPRAAEAKVLRKHSDLVLSATFAGRLDPV